MKIDDIQEHRRLAWKAYCESGVLPSDPELRRWCQRLARANAEVDRLHVVAESESDSQ